MVLPNRPARGFTLVEMLIVVAILAMAVAWTLPSLRGPLDRSELREGARRLRTALARTRLRAIETGVAQQFRFQPGTGQFETMARVQPTAGAGLPFSSGRATRRTTAPPPTTQNEPAEESLPSGIRFLAQQTAEPPIDSDRSVPTVRSTPSAAGEWSAPIVFYPNGRTTNGRIRLGGGREFYVDVTLRGVTGSATIGELVRREPSP